MHVNTTLLNNIAAQFINYQGILSVNVESSARSVVFRQSVLGDDYIENFQPKLSFIPVSQAEISARPMDNILLKHS